MIAVPSGSFLKEFTLLAERAESENETIVIQRANGKNMVLMSLDAFNAIQKKLYEASRQRTEQEKDSP